MLQYSLRSLLYYSTHPRAYKSLLSIAHAHLPSLHEHKDTIIQQYQFVTENRCLEPLRIVVRVKNIFSVIISPSFGFRWVEVKVAQLRSFDLST